MPKISIITVTYNAGSCIERTVKSVAEQSFTDYEHIIVDGASQDDTLALARQFGTERLSIHSQKDNGIYHGMNRGLKYAQGEFILFLNAGDTFATPDTLKLYSEEATAERDIIYGDTNIVDEEGKFLRERHLKAPAILTVGSFSDGMLICHQAFMVRRSLAPQYSRDYRFSADYDWTINCIKNTTPTRCINLRAHTIDYLDNGATEKHKFVSLRERFEIMKKHYGLMKAIMKHLSFIPRALKRKFSHQAI